MTSDARPREFRTILHTMAHVHRDIRALPISIAAHPTGEWLGSCFSPVGFGDTALGRQRRCTMEARTDTLVTAVHGVISSVATGHEYVISIL